MIKWRLRTVVIVLCLLSFSFAQAQVNTVEFGKNRVQYQKFNWRYYQTENFNTYFSQDGLELGKYVAQVAEKELPQLEEFVEYGLQRRANIVVYNNFDEMYQSNIGLGIDWQGTGGVTKLVNNKMMLYFDGNRENMRRQIRQGIASVLVQNILFGDDLGEFAANQTLLDLPKWLTDGYIDYAAEEWSTTLDNQLKNELLGGDYKNFYHFAFKKPLLAGHAFWYYVGNKYGRQKTTYLLYLARIYRNLNSATNKIAKKKFKDMLSDFMQEMPDMYQKDLRGRKYAPKGTVTVTEDVTDKKDFIRFNANPQPKSFMYAVTEFKQGKYSVVLHENYYDKKTLLTYGTRTREDEINPNYPLLAWDGKGSRLAVLYSQEGKIKLFIYDVVNRIKREKLELPMFDQVQDMKYMLDANTLLFSAVRGGQSDIFVYKIDREKAEQVTNDVYDDLDPAFVAFPGKTGIIFSSNRPSPNAPNTDTAITARPYNIFLIDNWNNEAAFKQISQLTNLSFGNARYPSAYSLAHFTFVSDENGIQNRYAGFFRSERAGLDTLVYIGDEVLRNPQLPEVDSVLRNWSKTDIDSVGYVSVTTDSAYVFPLTNYQASLLETRTAGDNSQVSEVIRQGDTKFLYKIKVNEDALRRRNVTARPTDYRRKLEERRRMALNKLMLDQPFAPDTTKKPGDFFNSEFDSEKKDSSQVGRVLPGQNPLTESVLTRARVFEYRPRKFFNDYVVAGLNNTQFVVNKYQPYQGGIGPIDPANNNQLNGLIRMGTVDLLEDIKISGGIRIAPNLKDNDVLFEFTNLRKRLDWGFTYYRSNVQTVIDTNAFQQNTTALVNQHSSYYLARLRYAFDRVRSIRFTVGPRFDRNVFPSINLRNLKQPDLKKTYGQVSAEYVYDNTLNPAQNIWHGLRYKFYIDWFTQMNKVRNTEGKYLFNFGFDARHYLPLYRNLIWAVRAAGDFSWGNQKVVYYLGGVDGWLKFGDNQKVDANGNVTYRYFEPNNPPDPDADYAYQALAVNLRGFKQNVANGNNNVVINSEIRFPVFSTLFNRPINNALLRNFQLVQFVDLGTAWNGGYDKWERPSMLYANNSAPGVAVRIKAGGIGPFAGGYGFGARSTLLGYFVRYDVAWQMDGVFKGKPQMYLALGLDF
ncbi:hypothetical protein [Flavisolibacter nicotianae]|uniref:hypothetical protein n=1 Tax=Flavisolibacter nicotianae TaxID=2364882 RepID=UPI000EB38756|nr:hypothetical protein [Flavisolibacter nicotianae]